MIPQASIPRSASMLSIRAFEVTRSAPFGLMRNRVQLGR